ncbi:MAG: type II toxin-antitoxin system RelE family toxin [Acidimicrobiales bacterium]
MTERPRVRKSTSQILRLQSEAYPHDAKHLAGHPGYRRIDCGEFRVCYRVEDDVVCVAVVGKRNDDEVYRQLARRG